MSDGDVARFRFPPLDRRGVLMGLSALPLAGLVVGVVVALVALLAVPGAAGPALAVGILVASTVAACWPVGGDPPVRWAPVVATWLGRRRSQPLVAVLPGTAVRGAEVVVGRESFQQAKPPGSLRPRAGGTAPVGIAVVEVPALPGEAALGAVGDLRRGRWAAVLPVWGPSLGLLDPAAQARQVACWGGVLSSITRDGSAIRRLQWVQRCTPADPVALSDPAAGAAGPDPAATSYRRLVEREAARMAEHRTLLVVVVAGSRSARRPGPATAELLRREVRLVQGQLRSAEITVGAPLGLDGLVTELAAASDPTGHGAPGGVGGPWPLAVDERWDCVRVDSTWQATYWVAEWPRLPVGADVLTPLLSTGPGRTVSVTLAPVPPERAVREAQSARTAGMADEALRQRAGFVTSARRVREAEAVQRREYELADGHGDYRFSGYVTVAATSREQLEASCGEVEHAAAASALVLRRLYGRQVEARTWTLPIGRGLS